MITTTNVNEHENTSLDLLDDVFNQQISELDVDMLVEVNESVIDESVIVSETCVDKSPKLNKKKGLSKAMRNKINCSLSPFVRSQGEKAQGRCNDANVITETPNAFELSRKKEKPLVCSQRKKLFAARKQLDMMKLKDNNEQSEK